MELISIGFLLGVVFSLIVFGSGVIFSDRDKRCDDNSHIPDLPVGSRDRSGNNRSNQQHEGE